MTVKPPQRRAALRRAAGSTTPCTPLATFTRRLNEGLLAEEQRAPGSSCWALGAHRSLNEGLLSEEQRVPARSKSDRRSTWPPQRRAALGRAAGTGKFPSRSCQRITASSKGCSRKSSGPEGSLLQGESSRQASTKGCSRKSSGAQRPSRSSRRPRRLNEGLLSEEQRAHAAVTEAVGAGGASTKGCSRKSSAAYGGRGSTTATRPQRRAALGRAAGSQMAWARSRSIDSPQRRAALGRAAGAGGAEHVGEVGHASTKGCSRESSWRGPPTTIPTARSPTCLNEGLLSGEQRAVLRVGLGRGLRVASTKGCSRESSGRPVRCSHLAIAGAPQRRAALGRAAG